MATRGEMLAWVIGSSRALMTRYFAGFTDANRAAQLPHMPNHFAWTLGHCAMTMHRVAERLDGQTLPERDFEVGVARAAGSPPTRFGTEGVAFGSTPLPEADAYPPVARCIEVFGAAFDRFGAAFRTASDER
ncbi:MAG TPA: DinB family protein, partial [Phycisphaerales bacterium]|nr:DinB family protein [Phycisphaerales bacterium]